MPVRSAPRAVPAQRCNAKKQVAILALFLVAKTKLPTVLARHIAITAAMSKNISLVRVIKAHLGIVIRSQHAT